MTPLLLGGSALVGICLGLLGGGGSILAVPLLRYGAGLETKSAIATSLLVVGTTSLAALLPHALRGMVDLRTALGIAVASAAGAFAGGRAAAYVPAKVLLALFTGMMLVTAVAMMQRRKEPTQDATRASWARTAAYGGAVGGVTGLVGAGGGFLIVPALVLLAGLPVHRAVGTSLAVITLNSFAALAGHLGHVAVDMTLATTVAGAAVLGTFVGAALSPRVPAGHLRRGFGVFVLVVGAFVVGQEWM